MRSKVLIRAASRLKPNGCSRRFDRRDTSAEFLTFPEYTTAIGAEIGSALQGERDYQPDTLQLLYIANRFEFRPRIASWLASGTMVICDRYLASSIAYGEAQGVDAGWLSEIQRFLPQPSLTILLDMPPAVSLTRKKADRDKFERDMPLLGRVRESYQRQAQQPDWIRLDGRARQGRRVRRRDQRRSVTTRAAVRPASEADRIIP